MQAPKTFDGEREWSKKILTPILTTYLCTRIMVCTYEDFSTVRLTLLTRTTEMMVTWTLKTVMRPVICTSSFLHITNTNAMVTGLLFVPRLAVITRLIRIAITPSLLLTMPHPASPSIASVRVRVKSLSHGLQCVDLHRHHLHHPYFMPSSSIIPLPSAMDQ